MAPFAKVKEGFNPFLVLTSWDSSEDQVATENSNS